MQINEVNIVGGHTPLDCPEDSVFFPPRIIDGYIMVPVLMGDSQEIKHYIIRTVTKYMTFLESHIGVQALGCIDLYGSMEYVFILEQESG